MVATLDEFATSVDNFSYCQQEGTDLFVDPVAIFLGQDRTTPCSSSLFMADDAALSVEVYAMAHLTLSFLFSGLGRRSGSAAVDGLESDDPSGCPP